MARFPRAFELSDPPRYDQRPSGGAGRRAPRRPGSTVTDLAYDIVAAGGIVYVPISNYVDGDLRAAHEMLVHPRTVPGLSDGGAHCTMIADFDYPTFLLGYWGRDAPADLRLPVEAVVKQQCADTAALVGLHDRGVLAPGKRADVNLIALVGGRIDLPDHRRRPARRRLPAGQPGHRLRHHHRRRGRSPSRAGSTTGRWRELWHAAVGCERDRHGWSHARRQDLGPARRGRARRRAGIVLHVDRHLVHDVTSPPGVHDAGRALDRRAVAGAHLRFARAQRARSWPGAPRTSNDLQPQFVPLMRRNFADARPAALRHRLAGPRDRPCDRAGAGTHPARGDGRVR